MIPYLRIWKTRYLSLARAGLLDAVELDKGFPIIEQRAQFGVLRFAEVALRLHDLIVVRHADFEAAHLGIETALRKLARRASRRQRLGAVGHLQRRIGHFRRHGELARANLRLVLLDEQTRARGLRFGSVAADGIVDVHRELPVRITAIEERAQRRDISAIDENAGALSIQTRSRQIPLHSTDARCAIGDEGI